MGLGDNAAEDSTNRGNCWGGFQEGLGSDGIATGAGALGGPACSWNGTMLQRFSRPARTPHTSSRWTT